MLRYTVFVEWINFGEAEKKLAASLDSSSSKSSPEIYTIPDTTLKDFNNAISISASME